MSAPNTSTYTLVIPDTSNLPNSRTLVGGSDITLQDSGPGGNLIIQPYANLLGIANYNTSGFMVFNTVGQVFSGVSFSGGSTINITNPTGISGVNTVFGVINDSSIQKVQTEIGGVPISTRSKINFIEGTGV